MYYLFLFFIILVFVSINAYIFMRGWQAIPGNKILHITYSLIFLFVLISFFLGFLLSDNSHSKLVITFRLIEGYWFVFCIFFLLAALFADFLRVLNYFLRIFPKWVIFNYSWIKLLYLTTALVFLLMFSLFGFKRFTNPQIVELNLSINKKTQHFDNLVIIAVSDIHIGDIVRKERLSDWVDIINNQNPDIILLDGDMFDKSFDFSESHSIEAVFLKLKSRYGVYAVLGNHEYYSDVNKSVNSLERSGIKLLRDKTVIIDNRFILVGRDDATNIKRKSVKSMLKGLNPDLPVIVLNHQPNILESVANKIDLQISGHTHNGQIFPYNLVLSKVWELSYGYRKVEDTHFYVSSGIGLRIVPIRFGTQSEIVRIILKAK